MYGAASHFSSNLITFAYLALAFELKTGAENGNYNYGGIGIKCFY